MGITTVTIGSTKLSGTQNGVILETKDGRQELEGVTLEVQRDRVVLDGLEQTLKMRTDGKEATVVDKLDGDRAYELNADGSFRFGMGGYQVEARPTAEGTLATPGREVNPLIPLESFLPEAERSTEPTVRTPLLVDGLALATSAPWAVGLGTMLAGLLFTEFTPAVTLGAAGMVACQLAHSFLSRAVTRPESYPLQDLGPLKEGVVTGKVLRRKEPRPGSSRGSDFAVRKAEMTLRNGVKLEADPTLRMRSEQDVWNFEEASLLIEGQSIKVKENSGRLYQIQPDGSLKTLKPGSEDPGDFAAIYGVTAASREDQQTELTFEEDEVVFDEFRLTYEH